MKIENEALLYGIILGDGCISILKSKTGGTAYRVIITLGNDDGKLINKTIKLLKQFSGKTPIIRKRDSAVEIRLNSKKTVNKIIKEWNFPIGKKINLKINSKFLKRWRTTSKVIAGLLATDGTLFFSKQHKNIPYYPRVEITSSSDEVLNVIRDLLLAKNYKLSRWANKLSIHGFESVKRIKNEIGFINPKHLEKFKMDR